MENKLKCKTERFLVSKVIDFRFEKFTQLKRVGGKFLLALAFA